MAATYEYHTVPDAEVIDTGDNENPSRRVLLEVLVLDRETIVLQGLQFVWLRTRAGTNWMVKVCAGRKRLLE